VASVVGALIAYVVANHRFSGQVETSEAKDLWNESREIRRDYLRRIEELNDVVRKCSERIDELEERNQRLYLENGNLKRMIEQHERTIEELRDHIHRLGKDNDLLRDENDKLRRRVGELEATNGK
jgi:regulator of replication initiation timing